MDKVKDPKATDVKHKVAACHLYGLSHTNAPASTATILIEREHGGMNSPPEALQPPSRPTRHKAGGDSRLQPMLAFEHIQHADNNQEHEGNRILLAKGNGQLRHGMKIHAKESRDEG